MNTSLTTAEPLNLTSADPRWKAVVERDPSADGQFFYSVATTGVYCRPSCAARLPLLRHVRFHTTCNEAELAGFRPCKRCKPDQPSPAERNAATVAKACRLLEEAEAPLPLTALAAAVEMSAFHFHRLFKAVTGLTPHRYAAAHRARRIRAQLTGSESVTHAIYDSGFNSSSRFYEHSNQLLGMTPTSFRAGGANMDIHFAIGESSLGSILVAQSQRGICAILLGDDPLLLARNLQDRFPHANLIGNEAGYEQLVAKVIGLVDAPQLAFDLPLDIQGTAFQQRVWALLRQIPVGTTATYAEIARLVGNPKASRAVARACAANFLAVAVPCHRVIREDSSLSGYRWGVERKRTLLAREAQLSRPMSSSQQE